MGRPTTREIGHLDLGTFGNTKACHVLVEMMNENMINVYAKHRVLGFIGTVNLVFKNLRFIPDDGIRERTMDDARRQFDHRIDEMPYPPRFRSFMKNVVFSIFKKNLEKGLAIVECYM